MNDSTARRKAALWVGAVFLLGATLGGVLGYLFAHRPVSAANAPRSEPERRGRRVEQLTRDLALSPQQAQQLDAILTPEQLPKFEEFLKRMDEEHKRNGPPAKR